MQPNYTESSPESLVIRIHPNLAAAALRSRHENAYALYSLAKSVHHDWIWIEDVVSELIGIGWSKSKVYRAAKEAELLGWITPDRNEPRWFILSYEGLAESMNVTNVGRYAVSIGTDAYKSSAGLKQALLRAFLHDKAKYNLSRRFVSDRTGIAPRTLTKWLNHKQDIWIERGYVHFYTGNQEVNSATLKSAREHRPGAFISSGQVYYQTPNRYHIVNKSVIRSGSRGANKLNRALSVQSKTGDGEHLTLWLAKRYHDADETFYATVKSVNRGKQRDCGQYLVQTGSRESFWYTVARMYEEAYNPLAV